MSKKPEVRACGVLIVRGEPADSFLLMKHAERWDLPKGHVDAGESDIECALREMEEETGLSRSDIDLDPDFRFSHQYFVQYNRTKGKKKLKELVIFLARLHRDAEIAVTEHEGYEWFEWNPPHRIQEMTIDPLLTAVQNYYSSKSK